MNPMDKDAKSKGRKLYKKPLIEEVELKPEEPVLTGCKASLGAPGPTGGNPICNDLGKRCKNLGS